jgi:hypothetical protein
MRAVQRSYAGDDKREELDTAGGSGACGTNFVSWSA